MADRPVPVATRDAEDAPPPFLGSWRNVYLAVLIYLACLISALYGVTRLYHYS